MIRIPSFSLSLRSAAGLLALTVCVLAQAQAQAQVTLNFVNADIDQVAKTIGAATGRTIIVDPRVKGQVNLISEQPVDREVAFKTLESVLRMQGFTLVDDHGVYKVVPEADAKLQGVPTVVGNTAQIHGDQVITQVFKLQYESANNVLPVLRPLISPNNTIAAYPANNTLVVTDYADNVRRIAQIIASIDNDQSSTIDIVTIQNASATDIASMLQKMLDPAGGAGDASLKIQVSADARTNSVILRTSNSTRMKLAKSLIAKLDDPSRKTGNIHVVRLRNADATKLAQTLRGMLGLGSGSGGTASGTAAASLGSNTSTGTAGLPPLPGGSSAGSSPGNNSSGGGTSGSSAGLGSNGPNFSSSDTENQGGGGGGVITADSATNSLIINAPDPVYRNLQYVIEELDARRAQVYIESLIVEVSDSKSSALGVQWQGVTTNNANNTAIYAGTNYGSGGSNIVNVTAAGYAGSSGAASVLSTLPNGLNIGILHKFDNLLGVGGLIQALDSVSGVNVLSTPNLITLDNEEAKIVIGQNVPFITGSYAQTGSAATVTPFQTYDREDVGITLRVKPQITESGTVKLQIYQESSSVVANTANNPGGVTTNKRSLQSVVLCDDGQIIVLGGLIQDQYDDSNSKVPFLGDIPVLGALFRSESKDREKTNLMIFLRPVVIRDSGSSAAISQNRYDLMRRLGQEYKSDNKMVRDVDTPVAPAPGGSLDPISRTSPADK